MDSWIHIDKFFFRFEHFRFENFVYFFKGNYFYHARTHARTHFFSDRITLNYKPLTLQLMQFRKRAVVLRASDLVAVQWAGVVHDVHGAAVEHVPQPAHLVWGDGVHRVYRRDTTQD